MRQAAFRSVSVVALALVMGCNWGPFKSEEDPGGSTQAQPAASVPRPRLTPPPPATPTPTPERVLRAQRERARQEAERRAQEAAEAAAAAVPRGPHAAPSIRLPVAVRYASRVIEPGRYDVMLDTTGREPAIVLSRGGREVARVLAVRPRKPPTEPLNGSWIWKDTRQEPMIRVFSQRGMERYLAVFEIVG